MPEGKWLSGSMKEEPRGGGCACCVVISLSSDTRYRRGACAVSTRCSWAVLFSRSTELRTGTSPYVICV